jgi:hypothetical protein
MTLLSQIFFRALRSSNYANYFLIKTSKTPYFFISGKQQKIGQSYKTKWAFSCRMYFVWVTELASFYILFKCCEIRYVKHFPEFL